MSVARTAGGGADVQRIGALGGIAQGARSTRGPTWRRELARLDAIEGLLSEKGLNCARIAAE
ncbi:hypothetical protein AB0L71_06570 [Streptomyces sp. NPDC052052]|uniref:hypothetical protein n=1 Tax=Streptomyces sp. NPDC052052 TaxID=3154756 RepID=UPI0034319692